MTKEELELERLREWFVGKYGMEFYYQAAKELNKKKKELGWWRRQILSEEDKQFLLKRVHELCNKAWKERLGEK